MRGWQLAYSSDLWTVDHVMLFTTKSRDLRIVFFVRIESRIESAVYHASRNTAYRTAGVRRTAYSLLHLQRIFNPSVFCICDEREWCTDYGTPNWVLVYFNSVKKRVKQCCCKLILLPKLTLNANLTTANRFFTNYNWQRGRFENFESDHQYESNLESMQSVYTRTRKKLIQLGQ